MGPPLWKNYPELLHWGRILTTSRQKRIEEGLSKERGR